MPSGSNTQQQQQQDDAEIFLPHIREVVTKLVQEMGYENPRFDVSAGSKPGEGYASHMVRVKVTNSDSKPNLKPLNLIVKTAPPSKSRREALNTDRTFSNEMNMYSIILPEFSEFMHGKGVIKEKHFPNTVRCYTCYVGDEGTETMVMDDLKAMGFALADKMKGLSKEHCQLVLAALARLHATSRAYEFEKPEEFKILSSKVADVLATGENNLISQFVPTVRKTLDMVKKRFPEGTVEHTKLLNLHDNYVKEVKELFAPNPEGFNVISHGDCWANNMMFKTDAETGDPTEVVLYDLQISRYCSPVIDLCYFLFLNTVRSVRGDLSELLEFYVGQFNKHLRNLHCSQAMITLSMLNQHMKKYGRSGIAMACLGLPFMLSKAEDVPDLDQACDNAQDINDAFSWQQSDMGLIEERLSDVLEDSVKLGYL